MFSVFLEGELRANGLFRRPESLKANAAQTTESQNNDSTIITRLMEAYRRTSIPYENRGNSLWQFFFNDRHLTLHQAFRKGSFNQVASILRNPGASDLFYGFDNLAVSLLSMGVPIASQEAHAIVCLDHLVRFAEAIGVVHLDNPESYHYAPLIQWEADVVIQKISQKLGKQIVFPNPYPLEIGLLTSYGIMSYRAPQALYQAYRIKQLLEKVENPRVLEIGAGLGRTAYYARLLGIKDYTIVDLPFTAMSSGYFLANTIGEDQILFSGEEASDSHNYVKMISPAEFANGTQQYDLIINVDGFTEVDTQVAITYWNQIEKRTSLFLSINHESNSFTVKELIEKSDRVDEVVRYPYWMRTGYVEELVRFK